MLNRRKQPHDSDDPASEERVTLLELPDLSEYPHSSAREGLLPSGDIRGSRKTRGAGTTHSRSSDLYFENSNHGPIQQAPYPSQLQSRFRNSELGSFRSDIYDDFGTAQSGSQTRQLISITGNDSYYKHQSTDFILYTIQPGDTLHNLSVKYSCPVASIKRLNNLWSDRDFYGLSKIKLPVGRLRLLADVIGEGSNSLVTTTSGRSENNPVKLDHQFNNNLIDYTDASNLPSTEYRARASSGRVETVAYLQDDNSTSTSLRTDSIFKNLDQHIEKAREAAKSYDNNANDIMQALAQGGNLVGGDETDDMSKRGEHLPDLSDFGLSYNFLILFIFIVCLVCPLAYVIYHEETHRDTHHHQQDNHHQSSSNHNNNNNNHNQ